MATYPSGEQHEIVFGDQRAFVVEVGGGLRAYQSGDLAVLDGFPADEMCHDGRGQLLIPWPNRLAGGRYRFQGKEYQLPLTEPSKGNAIHGLLRWQRWAAERTRSDAIRMVNRLFPSPGYPFMLELSAEYALSEGGLSVTLEARNVGPESCPFGAGQHPYIRCDTSLVDEAVLQVPAASVHRFDERSIPIEQIPVAGTPLDFRVPRPIDDAAIDMDFTNLVRAADGKARVTLRNPVRELAVEIWVDEAFKHVTVYTGETVQPPARRRQGLAVEPMTCPPNAFATGEDLLVLEPGQAWRGRWGIVVHR